jgi:hypothetical protein
MAEWANGHFDQKVFQAFVKSLGIYPNGSLVRLQSGRLAVVTEQNPQQLAAPVVKVFYSTDMEMHLAPRRLDLSQRECADRIVGRESAARWGFTKLEALWLDPQLLERARTVPA